MVILSTNPPISASPIAFHTLVQNRQRNRSLVKVAKKRRQGNPDIPIIESPRECPRDPLGANPAGIALLTRFPQCRKMDIRHFGNQSALPGGTGDGDSQWALTCPGRMLRRTPNSLPPDITSYHTSRKPQDVLLKKRASMPTSPAIPPCLVFKHNRSFAKLASHQAPRTGISAGWDCSDLKPNVPYLAFGEFPGHEIMRSRASKSE